MKQLSAFFILQASLFISPYANSQTPDTLFTHKDRSVFADFALNYYNQDGDHSAITGGTGTEKLSVIAQNINVTIVTDSSHWLNMNLGVDVITSASTDNIDFNISSASRKDGRVHVAAAYGKFLKNDWTLEGRLSGSVESDYLSRGIGATLNGKLNTMQSLKITSIYYYDDLRWGWYQEARGIRLIYPQELRGTQWFTNYNRHTYALGTQWNQIVNNRLQFALIADLVYQQGLLSTPYHRVYFQEQNNPKVELLPGSRLKIPLAIRINYHSPFDIVARTYYRYYTDDFDITAHTVSIEVPYQFNAAWTFYPFYRFYSQSASSYFAPFKQHVLSSTYYTSDFDLSQFNSHEIGAGIEFNYVSKSFKNKLSLESFGIRYGHYSRSDDLRANFISLLVNFAK